MWHVPAPKYSSFYATTEEIYCILLNSDISMKNLSFPDKDKRLDQIYNIGGALSCQVAGMH